MAVPVKIEPSKPEDIEELSTSVMQKIELTRVRKNRQLKHLFLAKPSKDKRYKFARPTVFIITRSILRFALRIVRSQTILNHAAHTFAQKFPTIGNRLRLFARLNPPPPPKAKRSIFSFIINVMRLNPILKNTTKRILQRYPKISSRLHLLMYKKLKNSALPQTTCDQEGLGEKQEITELLRVNPQPLDLRHTLQCAVKNWNLGQQRDH